MADICTGTFRLGLNLDYDRLHYMVSSDSTLRQLLGIETESGFKKIEIGYQRILDNLHLLDDETLMQINDVVISFGHKEVFKKKGTQALSFKTDSFVVETNVHFPTKKYLKITKTFRNKLECSKGNIPTETESDASMFKELEDFISMYKHIYLVERRILKGEKIPHNEKLFSIFEQHTEWIVKGKKRPSVELGKKLSITTDQNGLIVDGHIMENEADSQIVISTANRLTPKYNIDSWSFDKGYSHKDNKAALSEVVGQVIMR